MKIFVMSVGHWIGCAKSHSIYSSLEKLNIVLSKTRFRHRMVNEQYHSLKFVCPRMHAALRILLVLSQPAMAFSGQ